MQSIVMKAALAPEISSFCSFTTEVEDAHHLTVVDRKLKCGKALIPRSIFLSAPPQSIKYLEKALIVAYHAGVLIRDAYATMPNEFTVADFKDGNVNDLVTETDKAVEQYIVNTLTDYFPQHKFIGEESFSPFSSSSSTKKDNQDIVLTKDPTWIIDPIDGTTNFVHRMPYCCTSIGLWVDKQPIVGVVYNPIVDQMFYALAGYGAFLNGEPIKVNEKAKSLTSALLVGFIGNLSKRHQRSPMEHIPHSVLDSISCRGYRELGSAALNMCMTAKGSTDAVILVDSKCWDTAAGVLILREAGGVVENPWSHDHSWDLFEGQVLGGATKEIVEDLRQALLKHRTP